MATRTQKQEEVVDLYDILKARFLNTSVSIRGDEIHTIFPKRIRYADDEVGPALTRLLIEGYICLFYKRGSGLFETDSSIIGFIRTDKLME